jgi:hypothetical protein
VEDACTHPLSSGYLPIYTHTHTEENPPLVEIIVYPWRVVNEVLSGDGNHGISQCLVKMALLWSLIFVGRGSGGTNPLLHTNGETGEPEMNLPGRQ